MATEVAIKLTAMVDTFNQAFLEASKKVTGLGKDVDQMAAKLGRASKNMQKAGETMSLYVTAPIVAGLGLMAREYANQDVAQEKLNASLRSTAQYSEETAKKLNDLASAIQKETTVGDDASLSLMQLGIQSGISADKIGEATQAAIGLSKAYGIEMEQAIRGVALAQNGDYALLQKRIPQLKAAGTASEKYAEYQTAIANGYKIAQAEGNTFYGSSIKLKNAVGDLMEVGGQVVAEWITPMIKKLMELIEWLQGADDGTKKFAVGLALAAAAIGPLLIIIGKAIALYRAWLIISVAFKAGMAGQTIATSANTLAIIANRAAIIGATIAQHAWNLAQKANPIMLIISGLIMATAAIIGFAKYQRENTNEAKKSAESQERYNKALKGMLEVSAEVQEQANEHFRSISKLSRDEQLRNLQDIIEDMKRRANMYSAGTEKEREYQEKISALQRKYNEIRDSKDDERRQRSQQASNDWLNDRETASKKYTAMIEEHDKDEIELEKLKYDREQAELDNALRRRLVSKEMHERASKVLEDKYAQSKLRIEQQKSEQRISLWKSSLELESNIGEKFVNIYKSQQDNIITATQATAMRIAAVITSAFAGIQSVMNIIWDTQRQQVERKYEHLTAEEEAWQEYQDAKEQQEYNRMSVRQRREADLKKASDEAEAARERKKQKELAKIARQQAIMQRAIAMFQIPVNTAMAIMQIWSNAMNSSPYEAAKIGLTAMVSGLAAAQMAATMAAPLPQAAAGAYAAGNSVVNIGEKNGELVYPLYGAEGTKALDYFAERLMGKLNQKMAGSSSFSLSPAESGSGSTTSVQIKPVDLNIFADKFGELLLQITTSRQGLVHKGALVG